MKGIQIAERDAGDDARISIVIQTDGLENTSSRYRNGDLVAKVKEKTKLGWMFTFLGAGIDAFAQAEQFGISADQALRYGRSKSRAAFRAGAGKNRRFMESGIVECFLVEERETARDDEDSFAGNPTGQSPGRQSPLRDTEV